MIEKYECYPPAFRVTPYTDIFESQLFEAIKRKQDELNKMVMDTLDEMGFTEDYILDHRDEFTIRQYPIFNHNISREYMFRGERLFTLVEAMIVDEKSLRMTWQIIKPEEEKNGASKEM